MLIGISIFKIILFGIVHGGVHVLHFRAFTKYVYLTIVNLRMILTAFSCSFYHITIAIPSNGLYPGLAEIPAPDGSQDVIIIL